MYVSILTWFYECLTNHSSKSVIFKHFQVKDPQNYISLAADPHIHVVIREFNWETELMFITFITSVVCSNQISWADWQSPLKGLLLLPCLSHASSSHSCSLFRSPSTSPTPPKQQAPPGWPYLKGAPCPAASPGWPYLKGAGSWRPPCPQQAGSDQDGSDRGLLLRWGPRQSVIAFITSYHCFMC